MHKDEKTHINLLAQLFCHTAFQDTGILAASSLFYATEISIYDKLNNGGINTF